MRTCSWAATQRDAANSSRTPRSSPRFARQLGRAEVALQTPVLSLGHLAVDEQPEPVLERERSICGRLLALLGKRVSHAGEIECVEPVESRVAEHREFSFHS
jgi:hypothetical protein